MTEFSKKGSAPDRAHLADRVGIVPRLLACSLLAILVALASVQLWTLRSVEANGIQRAQDSLGFSMAILRHELAPLGKTWTATTDGQLLLGTTKLNDRNDLVDAVREMTGASVTIFLGDTRIATNIKNPDGSRGIGTKLAIGTPHDTVLRDGHTYSGFATILSAPYLAVYEPVRNDKAETIGILFVGVPIAEAQAFIRQIERDAIVGALGIALLAGLGYLWMLRANIRPLSDLTGVMHSIADGALDTKVPSARRTDQIGQIARALLQLRDASARARSLEEAAASGARAEAKKNAALLGMVDQIEAQTTMAISEVGNRTAAMTATAQEMSASAARTGVSAENAATASALALANAQTVAGAAEQLSGSIREINSQVARSNAMIGLAVTAGTETLATIEALNEQVGHIGTVADMIGDIAARTNLLALNATIEAARAGDAGKGFAVVASEVKALATQTARSTAEIAERIAQVRSATGVSVAAVARIEQTIGEISVIAGSIAAAVEEQGAATAEIVRSVTETARAAGQMTDHTIEVKTEALQTGERAAEVCQDAVGLNTAVVDLRHSVIRVVRTSTTEMDRRQERRYPNDRTCHLTIAGRSSAAEVADLSEHGAHIRNAPSVPVGTRGALTMDSVDFTLPFSVRAVEDDGLHLMFELDEATAKKFQSMPDRLSIQRVA